LSARAAFATHAQEAPQRPGTRPRAADDLGDRNVDRPSNLRFHWLAAARRASVPPCARLTRRRRVRILALAVLSQPPGSRTQLVGHARNSRSACPRIIGSVRVRSTPDVFCILAWAPGPGLAAADWGRRTVRSGRFRNAFLSGDRPRGAADGRALRRRVPPLHGADIAHRAGDLLKAIPTARQKNTPRSVIGGRLTAGAWSTSLKPEEFLRSARALVSPPTRTAQAWRASRPVAAVRPRSPPAVRDPLRAPPPAPKQQALPPAETWEPFRL